MKRRDFLRPRQLAHAAGQVLGALDELSALAGREAPREEFALVRLSRRALATDFEILLPLGTAQAQEAAAAGLDLIDELEDQLTVYRDTSEVSRINRLAALAPIEVEPRLFRLLSECARL